MESHSGPHTFLTVLVMFTVLAVMLVSLGQAQAQEINAVYRDWYEPQSRDNLGEESSDALEPSFGVWKPVSPGWGIPDTTATVGVAFSHKIPKEAFRGDVDKYMVSIVKNS